MLILEKEQQLCYMLRENTNTGWLVGLFKGLSYEVVGVSEEQLFRGITDEDFFFLEGDQRLLGRRFLLKGIRERVFFFVMELKSSYFSRDCKLVLLFGRFVF